jgi:transposase, IS5 family
MRVKKAAQTTFSFSCSRGPKIVADFEQKYKRMSEVLDSNPEVLDLVHCDLKGAASSNPKGRAGDYTTENILRALVVHCTEGLSFRDTIIRIAHSDFLCAFLRLGNRTVMDYSFLDRCFGAIRPATWAALVERLGAWGVAEGRVDPSQVRTDTTVTEANIRWPTDASLLWDSYRVLARLLRRARPLLPAVGHHRFHDRKAKRHYLYITRYSASTAKARRREVKVRFRELIGSVKRLEAIARQVEAAAAQEGCSVPLAGIAGELGRYLPAVRTIAHVAHRAAVRGEKVAASERIYSLFEQHAELIKRGRRSKPVEFGHVVQLVQTREKYITDYRVLERRVADNVLLEPALEAHRHRFGSYPEAVTADCGFHGKPGVMESVRRKVGTAAVAKNVREWSGEAFADFRSFRAGIEGSISVLKRAFGMARCLFKGFRNLASSVGLSVFCHNLVLLAKA